MNSYFADGINKVLIDFASFCKDADENIDKEYVISLIPSFMKSVNLQTTSSSDTEKTGSPKARSTRVKKILVEPEKVASKNGSKRVKQLSTTENIPTDSVSIDDVSIEDLPKKSVKDLKALCKSVGVSTTGIKSQLITELTRYKNEKTEQTSDSDSASEISKEPVKQKITTRPRSNTKKQLPKKAVFNVKEVDGLNLGFGDDTYIFVLSDDKAVTGFIFKEEYTEEDELPTVHALTGDVISCAQNYNLECELEDELQ